MLCTMGKCIVLYTMSVTPNYGIKLVKKYGVGIPAKMEKGRCIKEPSAEKTQRENTR